MTRKLTLTQVAERYGGVTVRTIDRWMKDEKLGFPQPMYIGRRPLWDHRPARPGPRVTAATTRATQVKRTRRRWR